MPDELKKEEIVSENPQKGASPAKIKLEELTVKQLQAKLVKLGMPEEDTKGFTTKAPLIATINTLKAANIIKKVDGLELPINPKEERQDLKKWQSKADRMREHLESQPKVRILIPLDPQEKPGVVKKIMVRGREEIIVISGAVWSKTFNGYRVVVPKGIYTEVSEQVADNIAEEFNQTQHAGDRWAIDRIDTATGKPVREQLT